MIVCDDDEELNGFIRNFFKLDGFETHKALSAKECLEILEQLDSKIDGILVNGKIASDRSVMLVINAKRISKDVAVFVLADKGLSEEKTRIMDYGADDFFVKPVSGETLVNKVNSVLLRQARTP